MLRPHACGIDAYAKAHKMQQISNQEVVQHPDYLFSFKVNARKFLDYICNQKCKVKGRQRKSKCGCLLPILGSNETVMSACRLLYMICNLSKHEKL